MGLFDQFPYTNFHELNLDWLIKLIKELENTVNNFVALNTIKYADPIQWNITTQYEANTVVVDPQTGTAYISSKAVPSGVALTNTDYWSVIFTLDIISAITILLCIWLYLLLSQVMQMTGSSGTVLYIKYLRPLILMRHM